MYAKPYAESSLKNKKKCGLEEKYIVPMEWYSTALPMPIVSSKPGMGNRRPSP